MASHSGGDASRVSADRTGRTGGKSICRSLTKFHISSEELRRAASVARASAKLLVNRAVSMNLASPRLKQTDRGTGGISTRVDEGGRKSAREKSCYFRSFGVLPCTSTPA